MADPYADEEDAEEIVVTGTRLPGSVVGDIPPENTLNSRDIRATGATDISELLEALAPQLGSARGRGGERPVLLLNGRRISGFREIRDIPSEAIQRVEILPEEVALKYGYRADQRVVNIILRSRFRSTTVRADGQTATEGGYLSGLADVSRLAIGANSRTTINLHAEGNSALTEAERDIDPGANADPGLQQARTLLGSKRLLRGTASLNRPLSANASATMTGEIEHSEGRSLFGLSDVLLDPLVRNVSSDSAHAGLTVNGDRDRWRWSLTANGDLQRSVTRSDRADETLDDRTRTLNSSGDVDLLLTGPVIALPAGDANLSLRAGGNTVHLDSNRRREGVERSSDLSRTRGSAAFNLDLPISRRSRDFSALGNLTLSANGEVEQYSDFGTLLTLGAGLNWSPLDRLNLIASWTREEGAPSIQQLGDPVLETPETRIFDFTRGETVLVTAITGGNPGLDADRRNVVKLGANWKPFEEQDLRLRAEYVRSRLDHPISSFPGPTAALEAAFPDRFERNSAGELIRVDLRPVNFQSARRDTLRWGVDFTKPLQSQPPSREAIERFRARRGGNDAPPGRPAGEAGAAPSGPEARGGREGFGGGRGFGRFGGGSRGRGGRIQLSLTHTLTLVDEVEIAPGIPTLDYLHGAAQGASGGRPRHEVEAQAGWFNNGLGARLSADWRSGTRVDTADGGTLRFSPRATFDLRLFANLGQRFDLVSKHPWLRGSSVRFEVANLFDSKPEVRDSLGKVPLGYQPDLLDPLGRTVKITIRKLFLPPPGAFRRDRRAGSSPD